MSAGAATRSTPGRHLCVVLHDVAPTRWASCTRVLQALRGTAQDAGLPGLPLTLLVVPRLHGGGGASARYLRWLRGLARHGHELALHGLTHQDEGPAPRGLRERLLRRAYTASAGEFAALPFEQATERLAAGRDWARQHGLAVAGFVPPAWLLNAPAWDAVAGAGFDYTCTRTQVVALPGRQALSAPAMVYSTRVAWRRGLSLVWNSLQGWQARQAPLLRLELHPADCEYPQVERHWQRLLRDALTDRTPLRLREAAELARQGGRAGHV